MVFLNNVWVVLGDLSFWLLLGCFASGLMHVLVPVSWFKKHLGGGSFSSVVKAVFVGVPMPLCSCGVIPAALGLKKQGAGDGASMGFLISTPQTGVDSIFVSASMLSWPFALFKLFSAFLLGLIGGLVSNRINSKKGAVKEAVDLPPSYKRGLSPIYHFAINDILYMIWRWLVVGIVISAAITTWMPADLLSTWSEGSLVLTLLAVLIFSLPLYVCATSSVPIAAALVDAGMPLSAALVFLMAGPATNMATIGAVYKSFGFANLVNYLLTIIIGSVSLAFCFDFILSGTVQKDLMHIHPSQSYAAYILMFFFSLFLYRDLKAFFLKKKLSENANLKEFEFVVGGLTCQGCVKKLVAALSSIDSVQNVTVNLEVGAVKLQALTHVKQNIEDSVEKTGFYLKEFIN